MDGLRKGWFTEFSPDQQIGKGKGDGCSEGEKQSVPENGFSDDLWSGQAFSLEIEKVLHHEKSRYQDVLVFKSKSYGNVLVLDGIIQCTERDECSYQEFLAHVPMFSHPCPKKVLIVGGGDGGIMREVLKHDSVESVTLCEIDQAVIDVSKKYLPSMAVSFDDPRVNVFVGDGAEIMKHHENEFDVIITDSSDPIGPAVTLFQENYYHLVNNALKSDGVLASQAESMWLHLNLIQNLMRETGKIFPKVAYCYCSVPTYPSGLIGYLICSKAKDANLKTPLRNCPEVMAEKMDLRFYSSEMHSAAFVLPRFVAKELKS